jgi:hypothetical protein
MFVVCVPVDCCRILLCCKVHVCTLLDIKITHSTCKTALFLQVPQHPHGDGSCTEPCDCGDLPCGEYLWNSSAPGVTEWQINTHVLNNITGLGNVNVSGFYFDDGWASHQDQILPWMPQPDGYCDTYNTIGGPTEIEAHCDEDMGLTQDDTTALTTDWYNKMQEVQTAVISNGGFAWQYFYGVDTPAAGNVSQCAAFFAEACTPSSWAQTRAVLHNLTPNATSGKVYPLMYFQQDLAAFLATRGPYAWLGTQWIGCDIPYESRPEYKVDYGVPTGLCAETAPGSNVFARQWTKANVSFDCNAWTGSVVMTA